MRYSSLNCSASTTIRAALSSTRDQTLSLIADISPDFLRKQSHPEFSPVGWHLGHIAYTESLWIDEHLNKQPTQFSQYERLFAADGLPKAERENLPALDELLAYLQGVRSQTLTYLERHPTPTKQTSRLWHWLIQHEGQHAETIAMVLALHRLQRGLSFNRRMTKPAATSMAHSSDMVLIESGEFSQGSNAVHAIDNEQPAHKVHLKRYWIDRTPVTCGQYTAFVEAGGYQNAKYWSEEGWQWLQSSGAKEPTKEPLYGLGEPDFETYPICGVSWYEAAAYAQFVEKRLPTEAEWEKAASPEFGCQHLLGNVWEWTDSWFSPYSGFRPFPYEGYSQIYFDNAHRVLRGGSWASPQSIIRLSFRTWYHPHRREVFAGFRCAM